MTSFLDDLDPRRAKPELPPGMTVRGLYLGQGTLGLEVLALDAEVEPKATALRKAWKERRGNRAAPVMAVAVKDDAAHVCGPFGDEPPIRKLDRSQAERVCRRALDEPDRNAALAFLHHALPTLEAELPGILNSGLLSDHMLVSGARLRSDWDAASARGRKLVNVEDTKLLRGLGFEVERVDGVTNLLRAGERDRAIAVLLDNTETPEGTSARFQNLSPVSWALSIADRRNLPWVVVVQGDRLRLYPVELGVGVGRRGRTETWIELRTGLLRDDQAALLWLVFSADALKAGGTLDKLLEDSKRFAADLAVRLRERIYDHVVPQLATGIAEARALDTVTAEELRLTYAMALTVLFRLLFIAYAEDRDLLPYASNEAYQHRALKTKARELADSDAEPGDGAHLWQEVSRLFEAIRVGDTHLGVPPYGGRLFDEDPEISPAGAALASISLPDRVFEPVLRALLLDRGRDLADPGGGPVDFRSLRVREFGTIYEGLLESELAVADTDLAVRRRGKDDVYVPARAEDPVAVPKGTIYLHNRSGARKASGSYFTPDFAVDHLLDSALEPALADHARRLDGLDDTDAAEAFFDFKVADIALGSGHFLVAAVDRIERAFSGYLTKRSLPGVQAELAQLRAAAGSELKRHGLEGVDLIEDGQLLRRLIARRCIYGVDLNPLAVDLARLSIWIHTFVPGLPLSLLDHSLVHGNALVGIGSVDRIERRFAEADSALFPVDADDLLGDAAGPLRRLARLADATPRDVLQAREAMAQAKAAVASTAALCDIIVAEGISPTDVNFQYERWPDLRLSIASHPALKRAQIIIKNLDVFHFPVAFPEVFLRERPGFDLIVGNPPWQEITVEELGFWTRHFPGLKGVNQAERRRRIPALKSERPDLVEEFHREVAEMEREREVLAAEFSAGSGAGDPDLYKAFAWRFWHIIHDDNGRFSVVLPRNSLNALGSHEWRSIVFSKSADIEVVTLTNRLKWVFTEVHPQFTFALVTATKGRVSSSIDNIALRGPFTSRAHWEAGIHRDPYRFTAEQVLSWTSSASLPLLPSDESVGVFAQIRSAPRLDSRIEGSWRARPDTDLHATNDKEYMIFDPADTEGLWPVLKGESFDIWQNDRGPDFYYAWGDPKIVTARLQSKRLRGHRSRRDSAHAEFTLDYVRDPKTLPCYRPRIAFRDVSRATDSRTIRAALIPANVFCANQAPYFLWPRGDMCDQAFLLGVLCSLPFDWYARRFVETHLNFYVLNPLPVPRPEESTSLPGRMVELSGRLAAADDRFAEWADAVGVEFGPLEPTRKQGMIEELDAVVAKLYGLTPDQLAHVFDTFHEWPTEDEQRAWDARRDRTVDMLRSL